MAPKTRELLAYLVLHAHEHISRDGVASILWPDTLDSEARANLRRHLSLLQRYLAPYVDVTAILVESDMLQWNEAAAWVDVCAFERLARVPGGASAAIELYASDFLTGGDAEWVAVERERLRAKVLDLLTKAMDGAERFGDLPRAMRHASRVLQIDPFREDAVRRLMTYTARGGDRAAALRIFRDFERRIRHELGVETMAQTRALRDLLASEESIAPESTSIARDAIVGRAADLERIAALIGIGRCVTITGPGGMGKTCVAERIVADHGREFADGAIVVKLDSAAPGSSVLDVLAARLDVAQSGDGAMLRALAGFFGAKRLLLMLDGCERDTPRVRVVADALLAACPNLHVLATSREPLRAADESVFVLPPLSGPSDAERSLDVLESDSAKLFLIRARAAAPIPDLSPSDVAALRDICIRLDGIPLALEIAASRCRILSIAEIARRLDDAALVLDFSRAGAPRHRRTLREIIAWAYDTLDAERREAFRVLALFRAPVSLNDIERLTAGILHASAIDFAATLVDCSLLLAAYAQGGVQYRLLEPIRDFLLEEVDREGEKASTVRRHIAFHAADARALNLPGGGGDPGRTFDILESQSRNVEAALRYALDTGAVDDATIDLARAMRTFWRERGHLREGYEIARGLCAAIGEGAPRYLELLVEASDFARLASLYDECRELAERARTLAEVSGDAFGRGSASFVLGALAYTLGANASARIDFTDAYVAFTAVDKSTDAARASVDLALIDTVEGRYDRASATLRETIAHFARAGERRLEMFATSALGSTERYRENFDEARALSSAALRFANKVGDRVLAGACLANLCSIALAVDDDDALREGIREGLLASQSGSFPFSLIHFVEVAARHVMKHGRFDAAARLSAVLRVLLARFGIAASVDDTAAITKRFDQLLAIVGPSTIDALAEEYARASTQQCVDIVLEAMRTISTSTIWDMAGSRSAES